MSKKLDEILVICTLKGITEAELFEQKVLPVMTFFGDGPQTSLGRLLFPGSIVRQMVINYISINALALSLAIYRQPIIPLMGLHQR